MTDDLDKDVELTRQLISAILAPMDKEPFVSMDKGVAALVFGKAFILQATLSGREPTEMHAMLDDLYAEFVQDLERITGKVVKKP